MKSLTSFFVPITRMFGYVSAACAVWVFGRWIYYLLSPASVADGSNGFFAIVLVPFLMFAALGLSVKESESGEAGD
jgi:hypothetical protein